MGVCYVPAITSVLNRFSKYFHLFDKSLQDSVMASFTTEDRVIFVKIAFMTMGGVMYGRSA